jgi:hypothetical protein
MILDLAPDPIDFEAFARTPLVREPFDRLVLLGFVPHDAAIAAAEASPGPDLPGLMPGPMDAAHNAFGDLLRSIRSPRTSEAFGEKFGLTLNPSTLMVILRARTRPIDGQIHTDSTTKVVTAPIYLNTDWSNEGGRLLAPRAQGYRGHGRRGPARRRHVDSLPPHRQILARAQAVRRQASGNHVQLDERHGRRQA